MKPIVAFFKTVPTVLLLLALLLTLPTSADGVFTERSENGGTAYRNRLFFFGESTTAHLRSRGVLEGGTSTDRVIAARSGTMMLNRRTPSAHVVEPRSGKEMTVTEAVAALRPEILVLSFGLNGIVGFLSAKESYTEPYRALIRTVRKVSPETVVILQTVYPVANDPSEWKFHQSPAEINRGIERLNGWLPEIAASEGAFLADTASVLRDGDGFLRKDYSADGIHLTREGYEQVLLYLETHMAEVPE